MKEFSFKISSWYQESWMWPLNIADQISILVLSSPVSSNKFHTISELYMQHGNKKKSFLTGYLLGLKWDDAPESILDV